MLRAPLCLKSWTNILLLERKSSKYIFLVLDSIGLHARSEACAHGWLRAQRAHGQKNKKDVDVSHKYWWMRDCCEAPALRDKSCQRGEWGGLRDRTPCWGGNEEGCFGCVEGEFFFLMLSVLFFPLLSFFWLERTPGRVSGELIEFVLVQTHNYLREGR